MFNVKGSVPLAGLEQISLRESMLTLCHSKIQLHGEPHFPRGH